MKGSEARSTTSTSKSSILRTYEEIAEDVEERRQTPWDDVVAFEQSLPRRQLVLDMGCGTGRNTLHYASSGHKVIALDFSRKLAKKAEKRLNAQSFNAVGFLQADVTAIPLKDSCIDVCVYIATLHHLPSKEDRLASLRELKRCLRPDGRTLVSVWAHEQERFKKAWKEGNADIFVPVRTRSGRAIQRYYHLFAKGELDDLVQESGLSIERCFKSRDNYFVMAVKRIGF